MPQNKKFTKEQELQICNEYFSEEKPGIITLAKKRGCHFATINSIIERNGFKLRTCSEARKGKFVGENHPMFGKQHKKESKEKMSKSHEGKIPWNKDIKTGPHSEITKKKMSKSRLKRKKILGFLNSKETREKLSKGRLERKKILGFINSEEAKQKMREKRLLKIQNHPGPYKNTKPELKMKEILNELNISFEHQYRIEGINHNFDFHICNTNILIEVDGDYWHSNPKKYSTLYGRQIKQKEKDLINEQLAKKAEFILLRFWEDDILRNTEEVRNEIKKLKEV